MKKRKPFNKIWPHVKWYDGYSLVEPCPWEVPEQTVSSKLKLEWWKLANGDLKEYEHLQEKEKWK